MVAKILKRFLKAIATMAIALVFLLETTLSPAIAQEMLPQADPQFKGKIGITYKNSEADPSILRGPEAAKDAPNIMLVLLDDVGFGAAETFGGLIETPTLERLANNGLRYNRFHTTALCSPTRAALLTGRNHHSVGTGVIQELATGFPGYSGLIPKSKATVGQLLQANGYSTSWFGKNHNVPDNQSSMVGPFDRQPNGLGFDYFYGFIGGETDQWYPTLYENQNPVDAPGTPEEGYNLNHDLADKAIAWMQYQNSIAPDRPFFLYFAPGATHAPHQPPAEYVEKYKGKFDMGWDRLREQIFEREKKLGVIPANTQLTPRPESIPAWDSYDETTHKLLAREMETYAGFLEYTDVEIGRVVDAIDKVGELDNTLIIYIVGDNGASAEGGFTGSCNEILNLSGLEISLEENLKCYDKWGGPETSPHYAVGWAWGLDAPFRWTKQVASYFGGTRNPMIVSWPAKISDRGGVRSQFLHAIDIAPTLLEVAGIQEPRFFNGIAQSPIEGASFTTTFAKGGDKAPETHKTQYFEMFAHRALYDNGWMASAFHRVPWDTGGASMPIEEDKWELFNLNEDFSQANDLSAENPQKLQELQDLFLIEGDKYNVFPIDDRTAARFDVRFRPSFTSGRKHFDFYPGAVRLPEGTAPNVKGVSHTITADLNIAPDGAQGVIVAEGGTTGGYSLYIKDSKLVYDYNYFNLDHYTIESNTPMPSGKVKVKFDFAYDGGGLGKGGTGKLFINGRKVGQTRFPKTAPVRFGVESQDVGMDLMSPVSSNYKPPFKFTGEIEKVAIDLK